MTRSDLRAALQNANVRAFLRVIRAGETNQTDDAYQMMFGGELFDSFADHPRKAITRKLGGKPITSTAAGAYQFLKKTWDGLVKQYGFEDFSPASQDEAAVALIAGRKALQAVKEGRLHEALRLCNREWASLPNSPYGQPTKTSAQAEKVYLQYGGTLAGGNSQPQAAPNLSAIAPKIGAPMPLPILAAILPALINAAPELIRAFGKGEQTERNAQVAERVVAVAQEVTGAVNAQQAAETIQSDPEAAARFREAVALNMDQWLGMMSKLSELDNASKDKARAFVASQGRNPVFFKFSFIELLSLLMILIAATGGGYVLYADFATEIKASVVTLMLIGGWNGVKEFWLGSSLGSLQKNAQSKE